MTPTDLHHNLLSVRRCIPSVRAIDSLESMRRACESCDVSSADALHNISQQLARIGDDITYSHGQDLFRSNPSLLLAVSVLLASCERAILGVVENII